MKIVVAKKILEANEALAEENRTALSAAGVYCVNVVGSPGCGKTTLLEALAGQLQDRLALAVIEGDIAGTIDAKRIDALGVPVVQINTDGACHLDATMIAAATRDLIEVCIAKDRRASNESPDPRASTSELQNVGCAGINRLESIDLLLIENVGNLVCTAGFDLGEHLRIVVLSTAEGDDKIAKYPAIFRKSHALAITKMDLLAHTRFDVARVAADMKQLAPEAEIFEVSALTGRGVGRLANWLADRTNSMA